MELLILGKAQVDSAFSDHPQRLQKNKNLSVSSEASETWLPKALYHELWPHLDFLVSS